MKKSSRILIVLLMLVILATSAFLLVACDKKEKPPEEEPGADVEVDENGREEVASKVVTDMLIKGITKQVLPGDDHYNGYKFAIDFAGSYTYTKGTESIKYDLVFRMNLDTSFADAGDKTTIKVVLTETKNDAAAKELIAFHYNAADTNMYIGIGDVKMRFKSLPLKDFIMMIDNRINGNDIVDQADKIDPMELVDTIVGAVFSIFGGDSFRAMPDRSDAVVSFDIKSSVDSLMALIGELDASIIFEDAEGKLLDYIMEAAGLDMTIDQLKETLAVPVVIDMVFKFDNEYFTGASISIDVEDFDFAIMNGTNEDGSIKYILSPLSVNGCEIQINLDKFAFSSDLINFQAWPTDHAEYKTQNPINFEILSDFKFMSKANDPTAIQNGHFNIKANLNPFAMYKLADKSASIADKEAALKNVGELLIEATTYTGLNGATKMPLFTLALAKLDTSTAGRQEAQTNLYLQVRVGSLATVMVTYNLAETIDVINYLVESFKPVEPDVATVADGNIPFDVTDLLSKLITDGTIKAIVTQLIEMKPEEVEELDKYLPVVADALKESMFIGVRENNNFAININVAEIFTILEPILKPIINDDGLLSTIKTAVLETALFGFEQIDIEFTSAKFGNITSSLRTEVRNSLDGKTAIALVADQSHLDKTVKQGSDAFAVGEKISVKYVNKNNQIATDRKSYTVMGVKGYDPNKLGEQTVEVLVQTLEGIDPILNLVGIQLPASIAKYPIGLNVVRVKITVVA